MTTKDLNTLLKHVRSLPEEAQHELVVVVNQIESELRAREYIFEQQGLDTVAAAIASLDDRRGFFVVGIQSRNHRPAAALAYGKASPTAS